MGNVDRVRYAVRPLEFLDERGHDPSGMIQLTPSRLLVSDPAAIGRIFRSDRSMPVDGTSTLGPLVGRASLLFANGPRHAAYREVLGPALRGGPLRGYRGMISSAAEEAVAGLVPGTVFGLPGWTRALTLRIIGRIVFGALGDEPLWPFTRWVEGALGSRGRTLCYRYGRAPRPLPSPWQTFLRRRRRLGEELVARAHRSAAEGVPCLAALLVSGAEPLGPLGDDELLDQLVSLLFAGHETTASAIAWTLYWLDRHPAIRADIADELAETQGDGSNAADVPLLDAACQEALRLTPPATLAGNRTLTEATVLAGRSMAAGTRLTPCIYLTHRRPDLYPHPLRFDPGRFLHRPAPHQYLPFGGGTRRCLGADLAMSETRVIVAAVVRALRFRCVNPERGVPQLRGPAMAPPADLRVEVTAWRR
ncbi:cytochrome P450 [Actinosynnema sp. NPDC053489]|uniref:cytochrome P450 n=1 Tax=Actinosynnema sp. NPDC053489 TaxID=3363916 RepID=UPI0037CB08D2